MSQPEVKKIFAIDIGESEGGFVALVKSLKEQTPKVMLIKAPNMRLLLAEISKIVKQRRSYLRRFPFVPKTILTVEESLVNPPRLVLPTNGK